MSLSLVFLLYLYLNYNAVCSGLLSVYSALWKGMVLISLPQNLYCLVNCPPDNQPTFKLILHRNQPRYPHLSIHLSIYLSIYLTPIFLSLHIYFYLSLLFIFLSIHIYPHIFFSIHLSLHIYLSTYLSYLYLSTYRPIYPYLSYHLSVFLSSRQPTNQPSL